MTKQEFLDRLQAGLGALTESDAQERLSFYSEMIDDRMEEGFSEQDAVAQVGDVQVIITNILAEIPQNAPVQAEAEAGKRGTIKVEKPTHHQATPKKEKKKGMETWQILLLILGFPLWLPLLAAAFSVVISLPIKNISYMELRELSYMGASVMHEDAVFPARMSDIPINIRNTNKPEDPGTVISNKGAGNDGSIISGIAGKRDFTVISIYKNMMNNEVGFVRKALAIVEDAGVSFDHIPTGIDSLSMVIASSELEDKLEDILESFKVQLKPDDINVEDGIAMIAIVGQKMFRSVGTSARICGALASNGVNIRMLNQGTGEINVIVGVEAADFEKAIRAIYAEFVPA